VVTSGIARPRQVAADWVAADLADHTEPAAAQVVSAHGAVVNLAVDAWPHLLMVAGPTLFRGPAAVGLAASGFAAVRTRIAEGVAIRYAAGDLEFVGPGRTLRVDLGGPAVSFAAPDAIDFIPGVCLAGLPEALAELRAATVGDLSSVLLGAGHGSDPFADVVAAAFSALVRALAARDEPGFLAATRALAGLGYGSTPTGDDLIHGALVAVHYLDRCVPAKRVPLRLRSEVTRATTRLGAHMIAIGSRGLTPEPVRDFLLELLGGRPVSGSLRGLDAMGADSGRAVAVGAALTVAALVDPFDEGEATA
jgi:hypothetical protein